MLSNEQRTVLIDLIPDTFLVNGIEYVAVPIIIEGTTGTLDQSNPYIVVSFESEGLIFQKFVTNLRREFLSSSDGNEYLVEEKGEIRTVDLNFTVFSPDMKKERYFREYKRTSEDDTIQYLLGQPIIDVIEVSTTDTAEVQKIWFKDSDYQILWDLRGIEWIGDMPEVDEPYWISYISSEHGDMIAHEICYQIADQASKYWDNSLVDYGMGVWEVQPIGNISHLVGVDWGYFYSFAIRIRYFYQTQKFTLISEGYPVEKIDFVIDEKPPALPYKFSGSVP